MNGTAETPLVDLLRRIPQDAILTWATPEEGREVWQMDHNSSPVGKLAHRAADKIEDLTPPQDFDYGAWRVWYQPVPVPGCDWHYQHKQADEESPGWMHGSCASFNCCIQEIIDGYEDRSVA